MQLPPDDEIVMISGTHPIRARKARYFEDGRLAERVLPPPKSGAIAATADQKPDDWTKLPLPPTASDSATTADPATGTGNGKTTPKDDQDPANAGIRREPELPEHEDIELSKPALVSEFVFEDGGKEPDDETVRLAELRRQMGGFARQAALDPADDLGL
jgi:type IV secretion system protein VirD4